jgi:predicted polyphosphate/ATP-dependent NAD kinase
MSSSCKGAAEYKSYVEFVMEKELEEAKAVVEECYRRRAKRAGLEGTLLAGRSMMERELDMLSEALGDGTGSRTKQRRE